jgi:hypothetical protein
MRNIFNTKIRVRHTQPESFDLVHQNRIPETGLVQVGKRQLSSAHFGDDVVVERIGEGSSVKFFDEIGGTDLRKMRNKR